jgi:hypothetical protein
MKLYLHSSYTTPGREALTFMFILYTGVSQTIVSTKIFWAPLRLTMRKSEEISEGTYKKLFLCNQTITDYIKRPLEADCKSAS